VIEVWWGSRGVVSIGRAHYNTALYALYIRNPISRILTMRPTDHIISYATDYIIAQDGLL
jgi:hypothetical protein